MVLSLRPTSLHRSKVNHSKSHSVKANILLTLIKTLTLEQKEEEKKKRERRRKQEANSRLLLPVRIVKVNSDSSAFNNQPVPSESNKQTQGQEDETLQQVAKSPNWSDGVIRG